MSEIITIFVGGCGTKVGLAFWEEMAHKKCQAANKNDHKVYHQRLFHEQDKIGKVGVPRAVFIDSDLKSNIQVCSNKIGFDTNSVVGYGGSCRNLFTEGKYGEGKQMSDLYYQSIRNQVEKCDRLSGFVMIRSCQGGAGSGIGSLVLDNIRQEYPSNIIQQINIFGGIGNKYQLTNLSALEIYNIHLSISESIQHSDGVLIFQNNAISDILTRRKITANFNQINKYLGHCLNQHVNAYIDSGIINTSQRKRILNLLPFPTLKFLTSGLSEPNSADHVISALHTENRSIKTSNDADRKMITINVNCRDSKMTENAIDSQVRRWTRMSFCKFLDLIPNQVSASICHTEQDRESSWVLYNGSINTQNLRLLEDQFNRINRRQAFLHHYFEHGLEVYQINHAFTNVTDLTSQYKSLSYSADDEI